MEWLRPEIDHTCGAKAKSALGTRRAWGEPHKQAVPALGSQGVQASQAHSVSGRWLKLTSTSWMCKQRCEALSSSFPPSRIEGSTWPQPSLSSLYFSVLSLPLLAETFYTSRWMLQNWWLCSAEWAKTEGCGEAKNFILFFFWQNQAWQDESLPLLVYSIFLYWIFIDSFVLSVTITDTLLFLLALSRGLQQQFDRSIEYRIKHANCPLNMVFILMPVNSKISKCFFRFLSLLQIFLKSMKFW